MAFAVLTGQKKLQVLLAGAVATSECPINVSFIDQNSVGRSASSSDAITTGNTAVDAVAAPPAGIRRELVGFSLYNDDTTSVTVTVRLYVNASTSRIVYFGSLLTDESLFYDENSGWYAVNSSGQRKLSSSSDISSSSSQASSLAAAITVASVNSASSQASSLAAAIVVASVNSVSSQASSTATNHGTVSSIQSVLSTASFTNTTWSTVSSAASRVKSSFSW